jgi:hypothetical protein
MVNGDPVELKRLVKNILSICGGNYTETFYRMMLEPLESINYYIEVFNDYQKEVSESMKKKSE